MAYEHGESPLSTAQSQRLRRTIAHQRPLTFSGNSEEPPNLPSRFRSNVSVNLSGSNFGGQDTRSQTWSFV